MGAPRRVWRDHRPRWPHRQRQQHLIRHGGRRGQRRGPPGQGSAGRTRSAGAARADAARPGAAPGPTRPHARRHGAAGAHERAAADGPRAAAQAPAGRWNKRAGQEPCEGPGRTGGHVRGAGRRPVHAAARGGRQRVRHGGGGQRRDRLPHGGGWMRKDAHAPGNRDEGRRLPVRARHGRRASAAVPGLRSGAGHHEPGRGGRRRT